MIRGSALGAVLVAGLVLAASALAHSKWKPTACVTDPPLRDKPAAVGG